MRRFGRNRLLVALAVIGPGVITAAADNDAGGIMTYTQAGARYRYDLLWVIVVITFVLAMIQEMCARMGTVTQKGLSELIRENFGVKWDYVRPWRIADREPCYHHGGVRWHCHQSGNIRAAEVCHGASGRHSDMGVSGQRHLPSRREGAHGTRRVCF
jgi:hypothetical protein